VIDPNIGGRSTARQVGRRAVLAGAAAAGLAAPALAQGTRERTIRFIPSANLSLIDPTITTAGVSLDHGFLVFDQLYAVDSQQRPKPQMAAGHTVSDDGRTWLIQLRDGLAFHDGEPVLARDVAASIMRWSARDSFGQALRRFVDVIDEADDRTVRFKLKRPMGALLDALAHPAPTPLFILPERLAKTDPFTQVTEMTGSGPFRFLKDEFVSGSRVAYAKFDGYVPRDEAPDFTSGAKRAWFDRVEWSVIPDSATASAALQKGEVDWWESVLLDLAPQLARNPDIRVRNTTRYGLGSIARFNFVNPPFNNVALRRVVRDAVQQDDYMRAIAGDVAADYSTCYSMFLCGLPGVSDIGKASMAGPKDLDALRRRVREAGYNGEKVVIMNPTDYTFISSQGLLTADILGKLGFNVDLQEMDFGTLLRRRAATDPVEKGGWSIFHTSAAALTLVNPAVNYNTRGPATGGWAGGYVNAEAERITEAWMAATTAADRQHWFDEAQRVAFEDVPIVPLGFWQPKSGFRKDIVDAVACDYALFWNIRRA
jgi:peptide/nickel transport system substrate-binding protein